MGNVSAITTADLYSSVKVSRRTRQLSFLSVRSSDQATGSYEVPVAIKESQADEMLECTEVSDIGVTCSEADVSSCNRNSDPCISDEPSDCDISEETVTVADCKLLSPCSVSVERLPFSVDDVDLLVAAAADTCCSRVAETVSNLITEHHSLALPDVKVNMNCKRWHSGRYRTAVKHLNKGTHTVERTSGSNTRVEHVHLSSCEINRSLPLCHVPLAFPSTWQQHVICGWLEDDAVAKAGEFLLCFELFVLLACSLIYLCDTYGSAYRYWNHCVFRLSIWPFVHQVTKFVIYK